MNRSQRLIREARQSSLWMLACIMAEVFAGVCFILAIQAESGEGVAVCGLFALLLTIAAIHHGREAWRNLELSQREIQYQNENENQNRI